MAIKVYATIIGFNEDHPEYDNVKETLESLFSPLPRRVECTIGPFTGESIVRGIGSKAWLSSHGNRFIFEKRNQPFEPAY